MARPGRAAMTAAAAALILLGVVMVVDETTLAAPFEFAMQSKDEGLIGTKLKEVTGTKMLEDRAAQLRKDSKRGKRLQAEFDKFRSYTHKTFSKKEGDAFTRSLEQQAPKKDSLAEQLDPVHLGIVPKMPQTDRNMFPMAQDMNLVQEWTPSGQPELAAQIAKAKQDDEDAEAASSGLKGHTILSATGLVKEESQSAWGDLDLSLVQTKATSGDWTPQGQSGLASQIAAAKSADEEDEAKENGIKGHGILSAAGVVPEEEETMFVEKVPEYSEFEGSNILSSVMPDVKTGNKDNEGADDSDIDIAGAVSSLVQTEASREEALVQTDPAELHGTKDPVLARNAEFLKAYSVLAADAIEDHRSDLNSLGDLLALMAQDSDAPPSQQYSESMASLQGTAEHGLPKYILKHISSKMHGKGLVVMGPVAGTPGSVFFIDYKSIGLDDNMALLHDMHIATPQMVKQMRKTSTVERHAEPATPVSISVDDFRRIFVPSCVAHEKADAATCHAVGADKAACNAKAACQFQAAWDGSEVAEVANAHLSTWA